jgi:hypothetical protein
MSTCRFVTLVIPLAALALSGQTREATEPRLALVIGNSTYPEKVRPLKNPANDANAMASLLRDLHFEVTLKLNATQAQMEDSIREFTQRLGPGSVALFYYAGHGFQIEGVNYLVPIDFYQDRMDALKLKRSTIPVDDYVLRPMVKSGAQLSLLILDACRNNPLPATTRSIDSGLAPMIAARGSMILFAAGAGQTADDNPSESNGIFTKHLIEALKQPGLSLGEVYEQVSERVDQATQGRQTPAKYEQVVGRVSLNPGERKGPERPGLDPGRPEITGLSAAATEVEPSQSVTLEASASDPNADPLQFSWSSTAGRIENRGNTAVFSAGPTGAVAGVNSVTVTVTARNSRGLEAHRDLQLHIKAPSAPAPDKVRGRVYSMGANIEVALEAQMGTGDAPSGYVEAQLEQVDHVWQVARIQGVLPGSPISITSECGNCTIVGIAEAPSLANGFLRARLRIQPINPQAALNVRLHYQAVAGAKKRK